MSTWPEYHSAWGMNAWLMQFQHRIFSLGARCPRMELPHRMSLKINYGAAPGGRQGVGGGIGEAFGELLDMGRV